MKIIGCDFHPGYQQIAMLDKSTGELTEQRLSHDHQGEEARKFYSGLVSTTSHLSGCRVWVIPLDSEMR